METNEERKIIKETHIIGDTSILFEGELYYDVGETLDTKVSIDGTLLCWINWDDKTDFLSRINEVINKYKI